MGMLPASGPGKRRLKSENGPFLHQANGIEPSSKPSGKGKSVEGPALRFESLGHGGLIQAKNPPGGLHGSIQQPESKNWATGWPVRRSDFQTRPSGYLQACSKGLRWGFGIVKRGCLLAKRCNSNRGMAVGCWIRRFGGNNRNAWAQSLPPVAEGQ